MNRSARSVLVVSFSLLAVLGSIEPVLGQSSTGSPPASSDADLQTLRQRTAEFWAARIAGDYEAQWRLLEPRWRGRITATEYAADQGGGRYLAYQVEDATVKGLFATVKVRVLVQQILPPNAPRSAAPQTVVVDDGWIRIGGVWYRRLEDGAPQTAKP